MPFGLRNAIQNFQIFTGDLIQGLNFVHAYADECFIASLERESHLQHLNQDIKAPISITVDASVPSIGGVLLQRVNNFWESLGWTQNTESRYSAFGSELPTLYYVVWHVQHHVGGLKFNHFTDGELLTYLLISSSHNFPYKSFNDQTTFHSSLQIYNTGRPSYRNLFKGQMNHVGA